MNHGSHHSTFRLLRWLPNLITGFRILLLPVFVFLVFACREAVTDGLAGTWERLGATAVLLIIGLGDVVDGALARRTGAVTGLGKVLDPLADKLTQVTGIVLFTFFAGPAFQPLPPILLALILARDLLLLVGSVVLHRRGNLEIEPSRTGKAATLATFVLLIVVSSGRAAVLLPVLVAASGALILFSAALYLMQGLRLRGDQASITDR